MITKEDLELLLEIEKELWNKDSKLYTKLWKLNEKIINEMESE